MANASSTPEDGDEQENIPLVVTHHYDDEARLFSASSSSRASSLDDPLANPRASSPAPTPPTHSAAKLTRLNGLALVVSLQIGSGIFTVPSQVAANTASPGWSLAVWLLAGLLVWTGAASFVELGLRVPRNGGVQEYLRASYGRLGELMGFLFTWSWVLLAKPAANAAIASIAAEYLLRGLSLGAEAGEGMGREWLTRAVALSCVAGITTMNCLGATTGAKAANVFLFLKLAALGAIIGIGFFGWLLADAGGVPSSSTGWFGVTPEMGGISAWRWAGNLSTAVFGALFCYGGWETIGFVAGDMDNPRADLPVVINAAMTIVTLGFCLFNAALFVCLPLDTIRTSKTVAVEFARRTMGVGGARMQLHEFLVAPSGQAWRTKTMLFSVVVSVSALGALNSNVFALAKICVAASQRGYLPRILANLHCASAKEEAGYLGRLLSALPAALRGGVVAFSDWTQRLRWQGSVPIYALIMNSFMTALWVLSGSFTWLITLVGLAEYLQFFLSVVGLLLLRRLDLDPTAPSAFKGRTWTGNPVIFSVVSGLLLVRGLINEPLQGLAVTLVALTGVGVFSLKFGLRGFSMLPPEA